MSSEGNGVGNGTANQPVQPRIQILAQYVKDLSFENPGAPAQADQQRPQIDLGVDLQARRSDSGHFEVELKLRVNAKTDTRPLFLLELAYAGLFLIENVPDQVLEQVLLIDAPHLIFPFARRIVADAVRDGGMPPLLIEPIDFAGLYRAKMAERQQQGGGAPVANA